MGEETSQEAEKGMRIQFTVAGLPVPAGSKRGFVYKRKDGSAGVNLTDANKKTKPWQAAVAAAAQEAMQGNLLEGPLVLTVNFDFHRPKSHLHRSGQLKARAPSSKSSKPDLSKLVRCIEDALIGIVYRDDAQITAIYATKNYRAHAGCWIEVAEFMSPADSQ